MDDGHSPPKAVKVEPTVTSQEGINLIKSFEGLRLENYYCASGVMTVGYGHTGSDVYDGMTITEAEAEALLRKDLKRFEKAVSELITVPLTQHEFDAIVSFAFNCGTGALQESTFRARMNRGDDKPTCFRQEFVKWNKGPNGPLAGLTRRREAEVHLATT